MSLNLTVRAEVINIKTDMPREDIFLVDTNIWLWYSYPNSTTDLRQSRLNDVNDYLSYLTRAASAGAILTYSGLILVELASVIERSEFKIFREENPGVTAKEYRHNFSAERVKVTNLVRSAWESVKSIAAPLDLIVDDVTIEAALQRFQEQALDGYDLLHLEAIVQADAGQIKILTDDCDYCTIPNIQLFTSNANAIETADSQNRLLTRT
jgi:hypothetical protein